MGKLWKDLTSNIILHSKTRWYLPCCINLERIWKNTKEENVPCLYLIDVFSFQHLLENLILVRALISFHFNVFLKKVSSTSTAYNQKKSFLSPWYWKKTIKYKSFKEVFQFILKSLETFLIQNYFCIVMPKIKNKTKSDHRFLNWNILNYFNQI